MVRVEVPLMLQFQFVFLADWYLETDKLLMQEEYFPNPEHPEHVIGQLLPSGPSYDLENNQRLLVSLIHQVKERVVLTTPYFVPDEALIQAMQTAILRGVHVHLVVSAKLDQVLVSPAQELYCSRWMNGKNGDLSASFASLLPFDEPTVMNQTKCFRMKLETRLPISYTGGYN